MPFIIPEMQRVKKNYPIYKDIEDVALMNMAARKFPNAYKKLALDVGERVRESRAAPEFDPEGEGYDMKTALEAGLTRDATGHMPSRHPVTGQILKGQKHKSYPLTVEGEEEAGMEIFQDKDGKYYSKPKAAGLAKVARGLMRRTGMQEGDTTFFLHDNIHKMSPSKPGENFFQFHKRMVKETGLGQREAAEASKGTIAQFEDQMTLGIAAGMMAHPGGTLYMLGVFGALEKGADVAGINKFIEHQPNVNVKDTLEVVKFGLMGAIAGGITKKTAMIRAKSRMKKQAKTKQEMDTAVAVVERVIEAARKKQGKAKPATVKKVEVTLESALAKADKATEKLRAEKAPKSTALIEKTKKEIADIKAKQKGVSSKVEVKPETKGKSKADIQKQLQDAKITPELRAPKEGKAITVESFGKKGMVPLVEEYKGRYIVKTGDNYAVWDAKKKTLFEVALDDSGGKRSINPKANNVETARKYIDWVTKEKPKPVDPKAANKERFKEARRKFLEKQQAKKPKTTSPKDQVSTAADDLVEVELRIGGKSVKKKMNSKQIYELKEQIREGNTSVKIIEKAQQQVETKATKLEAEADAILGKRTIKDQASDVVNVIKGIKPKKGLKSFPALDAELTPKGQQSLNMLAKDIKNSGKSASKYLKENIKLDNASASIIIKALNSPKNAVTQIKAAKKKTPTVGELATKTPEVRDAIIQEQIRNAKSPQHANSIRKKYGIKSETPTNNPAVTKDAPAIDPLMEKHTLFNPADKESMQINNRINKNLDKASKLAAKKEAAGGKDAFHFNNWIDTTFSLQGIQERTGAPVYSKSYLQGVEIANKKDIGVSRTIESFLKGELKGGHSLESDARIRKWITTKEGTLTPKEAKFANKLVAAYDAEKPKVKMIRMQQWIHKVKKTPKGKGKLVAQGRKILKEKGVGALEEWIQDKNFGVIEDGYHPAKFLRGIQPNKSTSPYASATPYTETRTGETPVYDTKTPLLQTLHNYIETIYTDYHFYNYLRETKQMLLPYNLKGAAKSGMDAWLNTLMGKGIPAGPVGKIARKARSQFFKTVLADPTKWVRNILQNPAFLYQNYPLVTNLVKTAKLTKFKLNDIQKEFFATHISSRSALRKDHMNIYDSVFKKGVLGKVDRYAVRMAEIYTETDQFNRLWAFKHALIGLSKDMKAYKSGKMGYSKFAKRNGLGSMTDLEIKHIMSLTPEQAELQIARFIVEKTHVRYKSHERGVAAFSDTLGETGASLTQFPKTVLARFTDAARMIGKGRNLAERRRGVDLLAGMIVMPIVANAMLQKITGTKTYYDPNLRKEVEYAPYSIKNTLMGIAFGGAQIGQVESFFKATSILVNIADESMRGGFKGYTGRKRMFTMIREVTKIADRLGESFQPFLKKAMDGVESMTDRKTYKLLTTSMDIMTKRRSALRRNKQERDLMERISHFFFGTERKEK